MTDANITDAPAEGPMPIWDTAPLIARIEALDPERQERLAAAWQAQGRGGVPPLMTLDELHELEGFVAGFEPGLAGDALHPCVEWADRFDALPEPLRIAAVDQLYVYAGTSPQGLRERIAESAPRVAEAERLLVALEAEAAARADEPSVADLPPVQAPVLADTDDLPSAKADMPTLLAWVDGAEPGAARKNRAARAWAQEIDRSSPRKGVFKKLEAILGDEGVALVQETIANATTPLDLGAAPPVYGTTPAGPPSAGVEGTAGPEDHHGSSGDSVGDGPDVETGVAPPPAVPENAPRFPTQWVWGPGDTPPGSKEVAYRLIAKGFEMLADIEREVA